MAGEKIFNYSVEEIKGKSIKLLLPELQSLKIQSNVQEFGMSKNKKRLPLEISITKMELHYRKSKSKKFFIILCRDIGLRKNAEKIAILAKNEAEKANAAKTQFLSHMSHEFRTPLNGILGFSQMLLEEDLNDEEKSFIQPIYDSGNHLLRMVNEILDISNIELGELKFNQEKVKISEVIQDVYKESLKLGIEYGTEIQLSIKDPQLKTLINVDEERVKQILLNILTNAIKFNRDNHKIILSIRQLSSDKIGFSVKDEGIGIAQDNLEIIFNPFERLNAYELGVDGLGIGLTIAKQLTEKMGGEISVESKEGVGSRFFIIFPICT